MKRLIILTAVAVVTATGLGCNGGLFHRNNHCGTPVATQAPACGTSGAYLGSPGGVYTGPDGYLPTPN